MLLRKLSLKNIRSYNSGEETSLTLPEGVVLFEGDIGSGKSTLLYALEFALFGLSDMKGVHLLSEGKKEGTVTLTFESGGEEYTVERSLKLKGDDVTQDECRIIEGGRSERLSPSDLKERVVSILGFNEPTHPKAESLVYRYAVFTPQEQMKEILLQNPEERLHVIRRVLGAQSYQTAADNSEVVEKRIREIVYGLRKASEDLDEKKASAKQVTVQVNQLEKVIPDLQKTSAAATKHVRSLESEWKRSRDEREGLGRGVAKIPLLRQDLEALKGAMEEDTAKLRGLEEHLASDIEPTMMKFESMKKPLKSLRDLEREADGAKDKLGRLAESARHLESDLTKTRDLIARGVCPLCGQEISKDVTIRTKHSEEEISKVREESTIVERELADLTSSIDAARGFADAEKDHARAEKEKARILKEINSLRGKIHESNMRSSQLTTELRESELEVKAMRGVSEKIADLETRLDSAKDDEKNAAHSLTQAVTQLADARTELESLAVEIAKKESALERSRRFSSFQNWLSSFFRPTVEKIEKLTLIQAASRFNEHYQRFFTSLVDDADMVVRVREDFSTVFEREGFEQDYAALSGGERTSMALAYRFALNAVVKESMYSRPELLILDEPTDGFSKDQVYKMRGLLDELDSRQVILVSHERELESMADHVFKVEKREGVSAVYEMKN